jgi:putative salt-induced outer membrane protein YdiY
VVILKNGDRISGDIVSQSADTLTVKTTYAHKIKIDRSYIQGGGQTAPPTETAGRVKGAATQPAQVSPVVGALNPSLVTATSSKQKNPNKNGKFSGIVNFSMKMENGNTDKDEIDADFSATYRDGHHRFRAQGEIEYDLWDGDAAKRDWQIIPTYDYFLSDKLYASMMYSAKQEKYAGLQLRQTIGPSIGYQFYDGKPVVLMSALGFYYIDEEFVAKDADDYWGPGWHFDYKYDIFGGKMQLYHRHYSLLRSGQTDKMLWHSWTGVRVPIISGVVGSAEFELDYDNNSLIRDESVDTTLRLKLGYEW